MPHRFHRGWAAALAAVLACLLCLGYVGYTLRQLPTPGGEVAARSIAVYDRNGQLLAERDPKDEYHVPLTLAQMGKYGPAVTLAAEDRGFYQHGAIDPLAMTRAAATDLLSGSAVEGGSTITQQLVKIQLADPQKTVDRKVQEMLLAWALEHRYSKDQILEMYLNRVYYGHGAYGLGAAAKAYFGKDASAADLTPAQAALLAGLIQAPNGYDPQTHFNLARERQLYVLHGPRWHPSRSAASAQSWRASSSWPRPWASTRQHRLAGGVIHDNPGLRRRRQSSDQSRCRGLGPLRPALQLHHAGHGQHRAAGSGQRLASAYGTSGHTTHLRFTLNEP